MYMQIVLWSSVSDIFCRISKFLTVRVSELFKSILSCTYLPNSKQESLDLYVMFVLVDSSSCSELSQHSFFKETRRRGDDKPPLSQLLLPVQPLIDILKQSDPGTHGLQSLMDNLNELRVYVDPELSTTYIDNTCNLINSWYL